MKEKIHIGELIREKLNENGQSASWLARKVHCDRSNFNKKLQQDHIDTGLLLHISEIMNVNFFNYYSDCLLNQKLHEE